MDGIDPLLIEASRWFKKLSDPSSATFKIAHARMSEEAHTAFVPAEILEQYRKTGKERMERLVAAAREIGKN